MELYQTIHFNDVGSQTHLYNIFPYLSQDTQIFEPFFVFFLQLLIGYERGPVILWDLKSKKADIRYYYEEVRTATSNRDLCARSMVNENDLCLNE